VEDAHKLSGYAGTLNWVLGVTTIYLAQASKIKITPPPLNLYVCIAMFKLQAGENKSMRIVSMHLGKMEDAPEVLGQGPISMGAVNATMAADTMVRGCCKNGGN